MSDDYFETSDFYLAVTLLSLGFCIVNFDLTEPRRVKFIFEARQGLYETIDDFWNDKIQLNPKVIFVYQKELKGRMSQIVR